MIHIVNVVNEWTRRLREISECLNVHEIAWQRLMARLCPLLAAPGHLGSIGFWHQFSLSRCYVSSGDGQDILNPISDGQTIWTTYSIYIYIEYNFWLAAWFCSKSQRPFGHLSGCACDSASVTRASSSAVYSWSKNRHRITTPSDFISCFKPNLWISSKKVRPVAVDREKHRKTVYSLYVVWWHLYVSSILYCLVKR